MRLHAGETHLMLAGVTVREVKMQQLAAVAEAIPVVKLEDVHSPKP